MTRVTALGALLPLLGVLVFFAVTLVAFAARTLIAGRPHEHYVESRPTSFLGKFLQEWWIWLFHPVERACLALGVPPDFVTALSTLASLAAAILLGFGFLSLGGWVFVLGASLDFVDGRVARATGRVSQAGAFLDSTFDRVADLCVLGGLSVAFRNSPFLIACLAAAGASTLVSYTRARGEALGAGAAAKVGGMQRPERVVLLGVSCALSPLAEALGGPGASRSLVGWAVGLLAVLAAGTGVRRTVSIYRALRSAEPRVARRGSSPVDRLTAVLRLETSRRGKAAP